MPATKKALSLLKGVTWELSLRYLDSNRVPVNLTGYAAAIQLHNPTTGAAISSHSGEVTEDGWINFKFSPDATGLFAKNYAYNVLLFEPDGDTHTLLYGPLTVKTVNQ